MLADKGYCYPLTISDFASRNSVDQASPLRTRLAQAALRIGSVYPFQKVQAPAFLIGKVTRRLI
jgi:hypothetical protein